MAQHEHGAIIVTGDDAGGYLAECRVRDDVADTNLVVQEWGATQDDALRALRTTLRRQVMAQGASVLTGRSTFEMAAEAWLRAVAQHRSPKTVTGYNARLRATVLPHIGGYALVNLSTDVLASFFAFDVAEGNTVRAQSDIHTLVTAVLGLAVRHGALPGMNPMLVVPKPQRVKEPAA